MRNRPLKKNFRKGPAFASFFNQNTGVKRILVWKPGTQSMRQRIKNLTRQCKPILDSRDPEVVRVGQLILEACRPDPNPKLASLVLINAGLEIADSTGEPWSVCASHLMHKYLEARVARMRSVGEIKTASMDVFVSPPTERTEEHASIDTSR